MPQRSFISYYRNFVGAFSKDLLNCPGLIFVVPLCARGVRKRTVGSASHCYLQAPTPNHIKGMTNGVRCCRAGCVHVQQWSLKSVFNRDIGAGCNVHRNRDGKWAYAHMIIMVFNERLCGSVTADATAN